MLLDKHYLKTILSNGELETEKNYWLKKLSGEIKLSEFPSDYGREKAERYNAEHISYKLPKTASQKVISMANGSKFGIYLVLLSVVKVLINKYTSDQDVTIGMPIFKQNEETNYINDILAIRNKVESNMTFKDLLMNVKATTEEAIRHKNFPFELLDEMLDLRGGNESFPLFKIIVLLDDLHEKRYIDSVNADIIFEFRIIDDEIELNLSYNTLLFVRETIEAKYKHFVNLLNKIIFNPQEKLANYEMLSPEEFEKILFGFNDTKTDYPYGKTLSHLFEEQVEKYPDNIAVVFENVELTYRDLNNRANYLANILIKKGIKRNSVVGLMIDRSLEMIICIIGILKAGAAYIPIDTDVPLSRIQAMLDDSGAEILLTKESIQKDNSFIKLISKPMKSSGVYKTCKREQIQDFDSIPIPDRSLVNYEKYSKYIGMTMVKNSISIMGSRGCPYNCAYCHKIWPKSHVSRSAEHIFREVKTYYDIGVKRFAFIDDIFNLNIGVSTKFFQMVIDSEMKIQIYFPTGVRGDILTKEYIDLMVKAGVVNISLALETASPRLQKFIGKNLKVDKLKENITYIAEKYPHIITELFTMHGFPTETEEEAKMNLDFIKDCKWIHFPYFHVLKIYPGTDMAKLAIENGVSQEAIENSVDLAFHHLSETSPFSKSFTEECKTKFISEYFLNKERLISVLPHQLKILTEDELCQKYNSYLPVDIRCLDDLLEFAEISREELGDIELANEKDWHVQDLNKKLRKCFPEKKPDEDALRLLFLDLSQFFSGDDKLLYDVVEPPTGYMYLAAYLHEKFENKVDVRIAKSRVDFDNYEDLRKLIEEFKPDIIGVRTLTYYRSFFHKTISLIRQWDVNVPILTGGPYATSDYNAVLRDRNIDLAILGEGEITLAEIVENMIHNSKQLPHKEVLKKIPGLAFMLDSDHNKEIYNREIIFYDYIEFPKKDTVIKNPLVENETSDLAYIMYTSGSTGQPKGNLTTHYNISRVVKNTNYIDIKESDIFLQLSNYAFDGSTFDIFGALLNGAKLVLVNKNDVVNINKLAEIIENEKITLFFITTALFNTLVDIEIECLKNVRKVLFGGERVSVNHVNKALKFLGKDRIIHVYGPTESTVFATFYNVNHIHENATTIPIGKPVANTQIYIIGKEDTLQPIGVAGELCISGDGLCKGYLNRNSLVEEKFIRNPFIKEQIIYKTGDIARWNRGGNVEFLGRIDNQVKIRGFRIELGEIEKWLMKYNGIKEAIVLDQKDLMNNNYICAYFASDYSVDIEALKEYLLTYLPEYMIPLHFIRLKRIPMNMNGKVDIKLLPNPGVLTNDVKEYIPPSNEIEKELQNIWMEILGKKEISTNENFFQLGGHSLKAAVLLSQIHKRFNVEVILSDIFNHETIKKLAKHIKSLKENKYLAIEPIAKQDYYELSSAQRRMYILELIQKNNLSYNMPFIMRVEGALDKDKVENIFMNLIKRHDSLRTCFKFHDDNPVQIVLDEIEFDLDYEKINENEINKNIEKFIRPFSLDKAPLLRTKILEYQNNKYILIIDMHHIISDGISIDILFDEFSKLYSGICLPEKKLDYKDYVAWQKKLMNSGIIKKQREYWLKTFSDEIPILNLPTDFIRPSYQMSEADSINFAKDEIFLSRLNKLASDTRTTNYMILLASLNVLLFKYTGQQDIIIGSPIAERPHADLQKIVGVFINTLPMKNHCNNDTTFIEFLETVKENALQAYENQNIQFEDIVEMVGVKRDLSRNPLFDVMLNFQNACNPLIEVEGLKFTKYDYTHKITKFDLTVGVEINGNEISFGFEYFTQIFKRETIERLAEHLINIIDVILRKPNIKISQINMLSEMEKNKIIYEFNETNKTYQRDLTINELFERTASRIKHKEIIELNGKSITYKELDERACKIANYLRRNGIKRDQIVGLMVTRSFEMFIGIMGILKAGGAYLPIDHDYPVERIEFMLEDSMANILLTQRHLKDKINFSGKVIEIDDDELFNREACTIECNNRPEDLAYVIYTSGSTGKPKGVMIEHRAVNNFIEGMIESVPSKDCSSILALTSLSFDIFVLETMLPILIGKKVVIADENCQRDFKFLNKLIIESQVDMIQLTPSRMQLLLETNEYQECLRNVKVIMIGGEIFPEVLLKKLQKATDARIFNMYGPTETTIWSCVKELTSCNTVNIGKPIINTQVYILNELGELQPIGMPGELCIGGDGLARGYVNNKELTDKKFIGNPIITKSLMQMNENTKIYKTGDLAMWLPNGEIQILGRIDSQVKIRGYRVELEEIENVLYELKEIGECIVIAKKDESGNNNLICYYVSAYELSTSNLVTHLSKKLPNYMIPSIFIYLNKMPLTNNGKVNRKALKEPVSNRPKLFSEYAEARNYVEREIYSIWRDILKIDKIGIYDNFFELGGNSMLLIRMHSKVEEVFFNKVSVADLFSYPTIAELARFIHGFDESESMVEEVRPIDLPESYFGDLNESSEDSSLSFKISEMVYIRFDGLCKRYNIEQKNALLSLFVYLLSQISDSANVEIQVVINEKKRVMPLNVDLANISQLLDLFKIIQGKMDDFDIKKTYDIRSIHVLRGFYANKAVPLFTNRLDVENEVITGYDIVLKYSKEVNGMTLICEYDRRCFNTSKIEEMFKNYIKLINAIADNY